jgi:glycosyltransferase involved in cell wall biosynthesis
MKIAIDTLFEHATAPSSAMDYLINLCTYMPEMAPEHEFYILVSTQSAPRFKSLCRSNVQLVNCFASNDRRTLRILAVQTVVPWRMRQHKIDLLFSAGNVCPWLGNFCRVVKINTMHHLRTPAMIGRIRSLYRRFAFKASARIADAVLANSSVTQSDICELLGINEDKVIVVWEAVDECFVPAEGKAQERVCAHFGLKRPFFLFSSTLWPYKNAHTLIRAFGSLCRKTGFDGELVFAGRSDNASYQKELDELVLAENVAGKVRFLGFVPNREMPPLYSAAAVFVYPSLSETFGKPLVEAMRCGVPVIASNTSCIPEIAGDGALLVDTSDAEELASAMGRVLADESLRAELVQRGKQRSAWFSWRTSALQTLDLFNNTLAHWHK